MAARRKSVDLLDPTPARPVGIQQRAQRQHVILESRTARFLLEKFAWGFISTIFIQHIALLVLEDLKLAQETGGKFEDLEKLANAGGKGKHPQNCHRDIMRFCQVPTLPVFRVSLPFKDGLEHLCHVLLPHETFAAMYHNYRPAFDKYILGAPGRMKAFWDSVHLHPALEGHWVKNQPGWRTKYVPVATHGDEVPVVGVGKVWSKSFLTFQWASLLAVGMGHGTRETLFWIWGVFEKMAASGDAGTIERFLQILCWSWEVLKARKWPKKDWRGMEHLSL